MVNINKREEAKARTREIILDKTKELIRETGVMNLTTNAIAKECDIAHGSIFLHFGSREGLINTVLEEEIKRVVVEMESNCRSGSDCRSLLDGYLGVVAREETFFTVLYRELPFFSEDIQRKVISLEAILRNSFFLSILSEGKIRLTEAEITLRLDAFFSTIIRYLCLKQMYSPGENVIKARRRDIIKLYEILFEGRSNKMEKNVCESCGMPMRETSEFGGGNLENKYCKYCTDDNGELKDFETKLEEMIGFTVSRMNVDRSVAEKIAKDNMAKMPAWKSYF